ncbi:MAG: ATP-binding protein [Alphaproteobacteria bacterium]
MKRIYSNIIKHHVEHYTQALFLAGPRQVGKTTLAKHFLKEFSTSFYLNWDNLDHRLLILKGPAAVVQQMPLQTLSNQKPILCLDEIHKFKEWKIFLKGLIDTYRDDLHTLVTGSSRLDVFHKSGDSLMGRYFLHRIHPLSVHELADPEPREQFLGEPHNIGNELFDTLLAFGGFPDPFLKAEKRYYRKWQQLRHQQLFQEDIRDLSNIHEISLLEVLAKTLQQQAGQLTNYTTLSKKIRVSDQTIRRWIEVFEALYFCFSLRPWSQNLSRSLLKDPKIYLWDWSLVEDKGQRAENFIASHLLKAVHFWNDNGFGSFELAFLRTKDHKEVDFLVIKDQKPWLMVEVKSSGKEPLSPHLLFFQKQLQASHVFQIAMDLPYVEKDCFSLSKPMIVPAKTFLSQLV